jgi:hypothetical protein
MIDWFVVLTPLLAFPVVLLFVFVGCAAAEAMPGEGTHVDVDGPGIPVDVTLVLYIPSRAGFTVSSVTFDVTAMGTDTRESEFRLEPGGDPMMPTITSRAVRGGELVGNLGTRAEADNYRYSLILTTPRSATWQVTCRVAISGDPAMHQNMPAATQLVALNRDRRLTQSIPFEIDLMRNVNYLGV